MRNESEFFPVNVKENIEKSKYNKTYYNTHILIYITRNEWTFPNTFDSEQCKGNKLPIVYNYFPIFPTKYWIIYIMCWTCCRNISAGFHQIIPHITWKLSIRKKPCPELLSRILTTERPPRASLPFRVIACQGDYTQGSWRPREALQFVRISMCGLHLVALEWIRIRCSTSNVISGFFSFW